MGQSGSHKAKSSLLASYSARGAAPLPSTGKGSAARPDARIAALEAQLAAATQALQSQRSSYDEDSTSFEKTLSRLAQSERALSQTKARLVDAETLAQTERARADALLAELAASRATATAEIAAARESASAAEAREQQALAAARAARFGEAANGAELDELQGKVSDLHAHLERRQAEVAAAEERNAVLTHERTQLLGVLASLEVLAREITQLTAQATTVGASLPKVEAWLGRDVESKHARATVRPEGKPASPPKQSRAQLEPAPVLDTLELES
jgi:colicin import membrane protein